MLKLNVRTGIFINILSKRRKNKKHWLTVKYHKRTREEKNVLSNQRKKLAALTQDYISQKEYFSKKCSFRTPKN